MNVRLGTRGELLQQLRRGRPWSRAGSIKAYATRDTHGGIESSETLLILQVHFGPALHQILDHLILAPKRGAVQCRLPAAVHRVHVQTRR